MHKTTRTIYEFLYRYSLQDGGAPTVREIADACYIGRTTVTHHLDKLEALGWITRDPNKARGIKLLRALPALTPPSSEK